MVHLGQYMSCYEKSCLLSRAYALFIFYVFFRLWALFNRAAQKNPYDLH